MKSNLDTESGIFEKFTVEGALDGILQGKTFVAKDVIDIEGRATGFGNPTWLKTAKPAEKNAECVEQLLNAGAILKGKSKSDEFALSLDGLNRQYDLPVNALYPDRICGGSSSGSASCVASGYVDFALGTDTVGSTRVPAAFNGIYGLRPGFDNMSLEGVLPLGKSFDTLGVLARDLDVLKTVASVLLKKTSHATARKVIMAESLFNLVHQDFRDLMFNKVRDSFDNIEVANTTIFDTRLLDIWSLVFSIIRSYEAFDHYKDWLNIHSSGVSPEILSRFRDGKSLSRKEVEHAIEIKKSAQKLIESVLEEDTILCLPSTWNLPPLLNESEEFLAQNRKENIRLTILSVISGLPQLSIPISLAEGIVMSVSLLGPKHSEQQLIETALRLEDNLLS